jgi:UDP-galactopyranose mutase
MSIRQKTMELYVSPKLKRRLFWLQAVEKDKRESEELRIVTVDEIVERLLNQKIEEDYPELKQWEQKVDELEKQLLKELT